MKKKTHYFLKVNLKVRLCIGLWTDQKQDTVTRPIKLLVI